MISHLKATVKSPKHIYLYITYKVVEKLFQIKRKRMNWMKMSRWCGEIRIVLYSSTDPRGLNLVNVTLIKVYYYYSGYCNIFYRVIFWNTNCRRLGKKSRLYSSVFREGQASSHKFTMLTGGFMTKQDLNKRLIINIK